MSQKTTICRDASPSTHTTAKKHEEACKNLQKLAKLAQAKSAESAKSKLGKL